MPENPTQGKVEQHFFGKVVGLYLLSSYKLFFQDELDGLPLVGEKKESKEESMVEIASVCSFEVSILLEDLRCHLDQFFPVH